jgi:tetratricopeptide (TPR) repeat protein
VAPYCYDAERSRQLLDEAMPLAQRSDFVTLAGVLECKLYILGGGNPSPEATQTELELEALVRAHPQRLAVVHAELAMRRMVLAHQSGNSQELTATLERMELRSRELRHVELVWHSERWRILAQLNIAPDREASAALHRLHRRAAQHKITGCAPFCAFDRAVVYQELGEAPSLDETTLQATTCDASDPPSLWAMKVRALASLRLQSEADNALRTITPDDLEKLPHDRDYLGTLGHLARAVVALGARDYAAKLYSLLEQHSDRFAVHIAFYCEGSVQQLLGMLAQLLERPDRALAHFESALLSHDRAGLGLRAIEVRLQLAAALLANTDPAEHARAIALCQQARASSERLALPHWKTRAVALREHFAQLNK